MSLSESPIWSSKEIAPLQDYKVIPLAPGEKVPARGVRWESQTYTVDDLQPGQNVGLLLGPVYDGWGWVELDVDCPDRFRVEGLLRSLDDCVLVPEVYLSTGGNHGGYSLLFAVRSDAVPPGFLYGKRWFGDLEVDVRGAGHYRVVPPSSCESKYELLGGEFRPRELVEAELGLRGEDGDDYGPVALREAHRLFEFLSGLPTEAPEVCRQTPTHLGGSSVSPPTSLHPISDEVSRPRRPQVLESQALQGTDTKMGRPQTPKAYLADLGLDCIPVDYLVDVWRGEGLFRLVLDYGHRRRYGYGVTPGRRGMIRDIFETEGNPSTKLYASRLGEWRYFRGFRASVGPVEGAPKAMSIQEVWAAIVTGKVRRFDMSPEGRKLHAKWSRRLVEDWNVWTVAARELRDLPWWESDTELGRVAAVVRSHVLQCARLASAPLLTEIHLGELAKVNPRYAGYALRILRRVGLLSRGRFLGKKTREWLLESDQVESVEARVESMDIDADNPATWSRIDKRSRAVSFLPVPVEVEAAPVAVEEIPEADPVEVAPVQRPVWHGVREVPKVRPGLVARGAREGPAPPRSGEIPESPVDLRRLLEMGRPVKLPVYGLRRAVGL
jgi:hypothetical protein